MGHLVYDTYEGIERIAVQGAVDAALVEMLLGQHLAQGGRFLIDLRRADVDQLSAAELGSIARAAFALRLSTREVRLALIAEAPLTFGLCRMLQQRADGAEECIGVYGSLDAAAEYLQGAAPETLTMCVPQAA